MGNDNSTVKDIESGKGLPPINSQPVPQSSGVTTEQRGKDTGVRLDIFTRQDGQKKDGK